ncbi:MAG: HK97 family phage prohead protease [Betaproteobacteria bacterium]|nr:HK97 family phage prohead protease [Betaproteobacteria bacterium]
MKTENQTERRFYGDAKLEVRRAGTDAKATTLRGYAAKFDVLSENLGGFREQIAPGAFSDVLTNDVRALFNHDANAVLGRTTSGTLRIAQDDTGLYYEVDLPDTQAARDLLVSIERGDVNQSSFGFRVAPNGDTWDENDEGTIIRTIKKFGRLYDVSPVTIPAYPDATVGVRSMEGWKEAKNSQIQAEKAKKQAEIRQKNDEKARHLRLIGG